MRRQLALRDFEDFKKFVSENDNVNRCIVRADLNLPSDVADLSRVYAVKDTVLDVINLGLNVVLISHYKRPSIDDVANPKYSLKNIANKIAEVLGCEVYFEGASIFNINPEAVNSKITLMENLRFYEGETTNDKKFAQRLAEFGDVYINDAFSVSHREHASVCAITEYLPPFAGYSLQREVDGISSVTSNIIRPFAAIIGGSKVSSKMEVLNQISKTADYLIVAGAMANTFLAANGINMQDSLIERDYLETARRIMRESKSEIILPIDFLASKNLNKDGENYDYTAIPPGFSCFDIGGKTIERIIEIIEKSKTLLWNGALGAFEFSNFDRSSKILAEYIAKETKNNKLISVIGGGETIASIGDYKKDTTFVSTAGGAFLEFVAGNRLPGIEALLKTSSH
ncbi:MAG: phosphoglycerate kinase [Holosporales bacterium]|jgi:phosphoglycerate kinase|nr:phosphoglycerate kinase [Holosporales bacterium]